MEVKALLPYVSLESQALALSYGNPNIYTCQGIINELHAANA